MDPDTLGLIIGGIITALGGGAAVGRYLLPRQNGIQGGPIVSNTNPGIINTGQVKALDIVTEAELKETKKDLSDSFDKTSNKIESTLTRQTDTLNGLTQAVTKLEAKVDGMPDKFENASMKAIQKHESRMHSRSATGSTIKKIV